MSQTRPLVDRRRYTERRARTRRLIPKRKVISGDKSPRVARDITTGTEKVRILKIDADKVVITLTFSSYGKGWGFNDIS